MSRFINIRDYENKISDRGFVTCRNCSRPVAGNRRFYCSESCMNEFVRNHKWELVRKDILKRDNYKCSICNKRYPKSKLDVDHIISIKMGGDAFDKNNLRILCIECHKMKTKLDRWALE